jgi:hypothetical protein
VVAAHTWAGVWDEGRPVLHPVGHLTIIVGYTWVMAAVLGVIALAESRGRSRLAVAVLCLVAADVVLLFTR